MLKAERQLKKRYKRDIREFKREFKARSKWWFWTYSVGVFIGRHSNLPIQVVRANGHTHVS